MGLLKIGPFYKNKKFQQEDRTGCHSIREFF
jgi:hypothetical protein